jgi:hypothetical protein
MIPIYGEDQFRQLFLVSDHHQDAVLHIATRLFMKNACHVTVYLFNDESENQKTYKCQVLSTASRF